MNIFFHEKNNIIWFFISCLYVVGIFFLLLSLVSYNVTDSSWFYTASYSENILNQGGFIGAQLAALLYYILGGAAFLLLIPLICVGLIVATGRTMASDGERLIASIGLVFIGAMVLSTYLIDFTWSPYPGGLLGLYGAQKLVYYFDPIGRKLFLCMSLCAALIIIFQWSFMFLIQKMMLFLIAFYEGMKKYRVIQRMGKGMISCLHLIFIRLPLSCIAFMKSLIDGQAFQDTGLLYPNEEYENDEEQECIDTIKQQAKISFLKLGLPDKVDRSKRLIIAPVILTMPLHNKYHAQDRLLSNISMKSKKKIMKIRMQKTQSYALPHLNIFIAEKYAGENHNVENELQERAHVLQDKLKRFGVNGQVVAIKRGPVVTLFEYQPDVDTKIK